MTENQEDDTVNKRVILIAALLMTGASVGLAVSEIIDIGTGQENAWQDGWEEACKRWSQDKDACKEDGQNYNPHGEGA